MSIIKISFIFILGIVKSRNSAEDREEVKFKRMCRQKSNGEREKQTQ